MSVPKNNGPIIDPALCRCCRAIKKCRILTAEYTWMGKKEIYADMVMDCYGILLSHVDDNEKDSGVCATCVVRLREATAFRHQVLQCEELFLHAKLEGPPDEEKDGNKLKKLDLELKTEPKDYNSDHNSMDDRDNDVCAYTDDDADENKPLKKEEPKPEEPPLKDEEVKSEDSVHFNGDSSSDSDEPIKKKMKRKTKSKANGAKKKLTKVAKKQKAETDASETKATTEMQPMEFKIEIEEHNVDFNIEDADAIESSPVEVNIEFSETPVINATIAGNDIAESGDVTENRGTRETGKKKRLWMRLSGNETTEYQLLRQGLESDEDLYFKHYNMSKDSFEELFKMVEGFIEKEYTNYRKPILARERLAVFMRYLRTGDSFKTISVSHGIGNSSVSKIVGEVAKAVWEVLQPTYMPAPDQYTWTQAERGFREFKKFPNCVGSIGGRHIVVNTRGSETEKASVYYSHYSCLVLLAVTDAFNNFTVIDLGNYGGDNGVHCFELSSFYQDFVEENELLPPKPLPGSETLVRHVLIGDESFTLKPYLMRAFPKLTKDPDQLNYNQCIKDARTTDTVFSMLTDNWHIFSRPIECNLATALNCVKAACCLHNYIQSKHGDLERQITEVTSKRSRKKKKALKGLVQLRALNSRATNIAMLTREKFVRYFKQTMESERDSLTVQRLSSSVEVANKHLEDPSKDASQVDESSNDSNKAGIEISTQSVEVENEYTINIKVEEDIS